MISNNCLNNTYLHTFSKCFFFEFINADTDTWQSSEDKKIIKSVKTRKSSKARRQENHQKREDKKIIKSVKTRESSRARRQENHQKREDKKIIKSAKTRKSSKRLCLLQYPVEEKKLFQLHKNTNISVPRSDKISSKDKQNRLIYILQRLLGDRLKVARIRGCKTHSLKKYST